VIQETAALKMDTVVIPFHIVIIPSRLALVLMFESMVNAVPMEMELRMLLGFAALSLVGVDTLTLTAMQTLKPLVDTSATRSLLLSLVETV